MRSNSYWDRKLSSLVILLILISGGSACLFADITYTLIDPGSWPADIRRQIESSIAEAVGLYNQHGSFNKHLYIRYTTWPGVTAEANFNGDLTFGSLRNSRAAVHEIAHTLGIGTITTWGNLMNGTWAGTHATNQIRAFDGGGALLFGDKWHFWPYGLNYDNEDGAITRIRHVRIVAALVADMGFLSFITEPTSRTVQPGASAIFNVNAVNAQGYTWYKQGDPNPLTNGGNISGANSNTLQITNVQTGDEGIYYCVASRSGTAPQSSRRARLIVARPTSHLKFAGNTYDTIGPNHGSVTGNPVYATGKIERAIKLNGVNEFVRLPSGAMDFDDMTIMAWVNWNGGGQWQRLFDFGNNTSQYLCLTPCSGSNTMRFIIRNNGGEQIVETTQLATGQWVHVAVTLSGDTATIYINGTAVSQAGGVTVNPGDFAPQNNYLGKSQFAADPLFNGSIDEFRIYSYALTGLQIQYLYGGTPESPFPPANGINIPTQLSLSWTGGLSGETAWQIYLGTSYSNVNNATTVSSEYRGVRYCEQYSTPTLLPNTIYYWRIDPILSDGTTLKGRIWAFVTGSTVTGQQTVKFSDEIIPLPDAAEGIAYGQSLLPNVTAPTACSFQKLAGPEWIAVSPAGQVFGMPHEGSAGQSYCKVRVLDSGGHSDEAVISIWVQDSYSGTKGLTDLRNFAALWLYEGSDLCPADLDQNYRVDMADWALFAADWNVAADPGLVAAWPMDETIGSMTGDALGRYPATLQNMSTVWRPIESIIGKNSHCLTFDGLNDFVEVSNFKGIGGNASRTCAAWIRTTQVSGEILTWGDTSTGGKWSVRVNETGSLRTDVQGGYIYGSTPVHDGRWHHVAVVLENVGTANIANARLYVDGILETVAGVLECQVNTSSANNVRIGAFHTEPHYFRGMIDNVRIYERPLSSADIADLAQSSLVAHWPLDDRKGMIAAEVKSGFDAALVNMNDSNWVVSPHGNALMFNGTSQALCVPGYKGVPGMSSRSCTAWVKTGGSTAEQVIISWGSSATMGSRWIFRIQPGGEPAVAVGGGYIQANLPVSDNQWHHVAAVLYSDGAPTIDEVVFYVDGIEQPATATSAFPINTSTAEPVYIGMLNSTAFPGYFNGFLDELKVYNRALTALEIAELAQ